MGKKTLTAKKRKKKGLRPKLKKVRPKKSKKSKKPKQPKRPKKAGKGGSKYKPDPERPHKIHGKKWYKPFRPKQWPEKSGFIPPACKDLVGTPAYLDCWLGENPEIADAIVWEQAPGGPSQFVKWSNWSPSMKAQLRQAWLDARSWHAGGMVNFPGTFVEDPPPNQDYATDGAPYFRTVLEGPTQAWPLYLALVAHSLAAETDGWLSWSLRDLTSGALEHLLSGTMMFRRDTNDGGAWDSDYPGGYVLGGSQSLEKITPSHPTFTYPFLVQNNVVGATQLDTIARVLDWCRWNLSHYLGGFTPQNAEYHWQYRGAAPARRIIEGTLLLDPQYASSFPAPNHWIPGCWGTSAFLRSLLRAVNIPVRPRICGCGHITPWFVSVDRFLSHGDDPYNSLAKANFAASELLLDEATFDAWFPFDPNDPQNPANQATACEHVGRRVVELAIWHFSDSLLNDYCSDKANNLDHASGKVFAHFSPHQYTVPQLEATQLWVRLEAEAQAQSKC